ncbi:MAG TPA: hypothetical protein VK668_09655 [Mucilaginibacter sp.]|nr:hypothetical protein [Mucilaginibacter sp.]
MKSFLLTCLVLLNLSVTFAQTEAERFKKDQLKSKYLSEKEFKDQLIKHNFSSLVTHTDNSMVYGFIGDNYQRIRIKFITVTKDAVSPDTYHIYGKSMVKNNVDEFRGTITISNIRKLKVTSYGVDDEYKNKGIKGEFVIIGDYSFAEAEQQNHSGFFKGIFKSGFYLDKSNKVRYDDIESNADGYTNNQFVGQWIDYKTKIAKRCNWGDFRVPNSSDLDMGAGEFSPSDKYLKYGWQSLREHDEKVENAKWWQ